jgi:glycosyltransferase involved in cell wall biosynthesis
MNELLSVIVPCYNVEKYVEKSIKSIANQEYKNIEIIAIDDCSTDKTYSILKELEKDIKNLKVFKNEKNDGLAYTRNVGVKHSKGQYLGFIDSDDYIDKDYYKLLVGNLKDDIEVVVTDMILVDENGMELQPLISCCIGEINKFNIVDNGLAASACNKLFKKELLVKHPFLEGKINEDVASIIPIIVNCKGVAYTNKTKYYYVQRNNSIQNSEFSEKRFDMFDAVKKCLESIKDDEQYEKYKETILYHQVLMLYLCIIVNQKDFFKRYNLIKIFIGKQQEYKLHNNKYLSAFINGQVKRDRKYYKTLAKLLKYNNAMLINIIIWIRKDIINCLKTFVKNTINKLKNSYRIITNRTVIKYDIKIKDLIKLAKKQSKLKENDVKVSVVIPNYNYEKFLLSRIYSILNQTEKIHELIILDDCSKDNSRELIDEIVSNLKKYINIKKVYNKENTGSAFKQWAKGFKLAKGEYVWIAEADDCCQKTLLSNLLKPIRKNKQVYISYSDTAFINPWEKIFLKSIKSEIDIMKTGHWDKDYINKGIDEVLNYSFLNCTIANVSSCLIKNDNYDEIFEKIGEYKQAGDWLFYVEVIKKGYIAYTDKPLNYYRVHGENITSKMKKNKHLEEIKKIHKEISGEFELNTWHEDERRKRYEFLIRVWEL